MFCVLCSEILGYLVKDRCTQRSHEAKRYAFPGRILVGWPSYVCRMEYEFVKSRSTAASNLARASWAEIPVVSVSRPKTEGRLQHMNVSASEPYALLVPGPCSDSQYRVIYGTLGALDQVMHPGPVTTVVLLKSTMPVLLGRPPR